MKSVKAILNPKDAIYSVVTTNNNMADNLIDAYKDKVFLLPSIEEDGLALIRFYLNQDGLSNGQLYTEVYCAHLFKFVNFWNFLLFIINTIMLNGDVIQAVHDYFASLESYLSSNYSIDENLIYTCPCCGSKLLVLGNREYCVNVNCAQFDFYTTLTSKFSILTRNAYKPNKRTLTKLVESHICNQSLSPVDPSVFSSLNLQQLLLSLVFQHMSDKLTKNTIDALLSIRMDTIFQLFKIPSVIAEDVQNYLQSTIISQGTSLKDDIQLLRSIVYYSQLGTNHLTGLFDVDNYIRHALEVNSSFLDTLLYLLETIQNSKN